MKLIIKYVYFGLILLQVLTLYNINKTTQFQALKIKILKLIMYIFETKTYLYIEKMFEVQLLYYSLCRWKNVNVHIV